MKLAGITGVTGQIGSYLAEFLLKKNYRVIGLKRRTSTINSTSRIDHLLKHPNFSLEYFDLNDPISIFTTISKHQFHEFYNLACMSHVRVSYDLPEEALSTVALGPLRILEAIYKTSAHTRLYQASSSEQFGINPSPPYNEESKFMPASPYACAKTCAHNLVVNYRSAYGLYACCGIVFNTESERRGENFVTRKITLNTAKIKLGLQTHFSLGNIDSYRDWSYAADVVEAMWSMLQQSKPDDFVLASGETHTVKDFLIETFKNAELDGDPMSYIKIDPIYFRPQEVPYLLGDASKAKSILKWNPKVKFKELVKIMYNSDLELLKGNKI